MIKKFSIINGDYQLRNSGARAVLLIAAFIILGALISFFLLFNNIKLNQITIQVQEQIALWGKIREHLIYISSKQKENSLPDYLVRRVQTEVVGFLKKDELINKKIKTLLDKTRLYRSLSLSTDLGEALLFGESLAPSEKELVNNFVKAPPVLLKVGTAAWQTTSFIRLQNGEYLFLLYQKLKIARAISERGLQTLLWASFFVYGLILAGIALIWFYKMRPAFDYIDEGNKSLELNSNALLEKNQELLQIEHHSKTAQRIAQFGYWTLDNKGKVDCSDGLLRILKITNCKRPSSLKDMIELSPSEFFPNIEAFYSEARKTQQSVEITRPIILTDGTKRIVREMVEHEMIDANKTSLLYGIILDITDHAETQARLGQAQKLKAVGQLTGGIAHDLNNMLAIVSGNAELISIKNPELETHRINNIINATQKGVKLIDQMLLFSGRFSLLPETVKIQDIILDMSELLQRSLTEEINLEYQIDDNAWPVYMDQGQLENVLINLILNARDAVDKEGKIIISCQNFICGDQKARELDLEVGDYVCLSVCDNGAGMSEDLKERIFEPFFTQKISKKNGRGLGLSMVYGFVHASNGKIEVVSELNKGAKFNLYFPRSYFSVSKDYASEDTTLVMGGAEMVLVVEDKKDLRQVIVAQLNRLGYQTMEAAKVNEAKKLIAESANIDLILSDILLTEGGRGVDFVSEDMDENINVVLMSGDTSLCEKYAQEFGDKLQILRKPFSLGTLSKVLRTAIGNG